MTVDYAENGPGFYDEEDEHIPFIKEHYGVDEIKVNDKELWVIDIDDLPLADEFGRSPLERLRDMLRYFRVALEVGFGNQLGSLAFASKRIDAGLVVGIDPHIDIEKLKKSPKEETDHLPGRTVLIKADIEDKRISRLFEDPYQRGNQNKIPAYVQIVAPDTDHLFRVVTGAIHFSKDAALVVLDSGTVEAYEKGVLRLSEFHQNILKESGIENPTAIDWLRHVLKGYSEKQLTTQEYQNAMLQGEYPPTAHLHEGKMIVFEKKPVFERIGEYDSSELPPYGEELKTIRDVLSTLREFIEQGKKSDKIPQWNPEFLERVVDFLEQSTDESVAYFFLDDLSAIEARSSEEKWPMETTAKHLRQLIRSYKGADRLEGLYLLEIKQVFRKNGVVPKHFRNFRYHKPNDSRLKLDGFCEVRVTRGKKEIKIELKPEMDGPNVCIAEPLRELTIRVGKESIAIEPSFTMRSVTLQQELTRHPELIHGLMGSFVQVMSAYRADSSPNRQAFYDSRTGRMGGIQQPLAEAEPDYLLTQLFDRLLPTYLKNRLSENDMHAYTLLVDLIEKNELVPIIYLGEINRSIFDTRQFQAKIDELKLTTEERNTLTRMNVSMRAILEDHDIQVTETGIKDFGSIMERFITDSEFRSMLWKLTRQYFEKDNSKFKKLVEEKARLKYGSFAALIEITALKLARTQSARNDLLQELSGQIQVFQSDH